MVTWPRLTGLFRVLQDWVEALREKSSVPLFVFGPRCVVQKKIDFGSNEFPV